MTLKPYLGVLVAAGILLLAVGAYLAWYGIVSSEAAAAAEAGNEVRALGEIGGRAATVRRAGEELTRQEESVYAHFVDTTTIVSFIESIESTGRDLGAGVEVVSVGDPQGQGNARQLQMSLRITGSFDAVMRTFGAIEYQPFDTTLTSLTLDAPGGSGRWTAAATFMVGMRPETTP